MDEVAKLNADIAKIVMAWWTEDTPEDFDPEQAIDLGLLIQEIVMYIQNNRKI